MTSIEAPKGTHDIVPRDQPLWRFVTGTMERLCEQYGYRPVQTPVFEDTELFARTSGEGSDVVQKEMYTFSDRGDRSLTLRPEGTAPICRAYIEHGMHREPQPVKLYTIAPMYRYAAPQRGRYREHWQLSLEAIGSADPAVDAEVLEYYRTLLSTLGVKSFQLQLNSIGDAACRPAYLEKLNAWLDANADVLDEDARGKRATSPMRVFDVKNPAVRAALENAPKIGDSLCTDCEAHFADVRRYLDAYGVEYVLDPTLVRGLDYYTRTTWEFVGPDETGQAGTISGGGRYDGLIEEIGGPPTPGIGFGAGIERLILALEHEGVTVEEPGIDVFFAVDEAADRAAVLVELTKLRHDGLRCDTDYAGRSAKGQMTQAGRLGARIVVRVEGETATLRSEGQDLGEPVPVSQIADAVRGTPAHHPL